MFNRLVVLRGLVLVTLLGSWPLLNAQVTTPVITSLQSGPTIPTGTPPPPAHGAAITAATPGQEFLLYVNGNFDTEENFEEVLWNNGGEGSIQLNIISQTDTQLIANVPSFLYQTAGTASVTVQEFSFEEAGIARAPQARIQRLAPRATSNAVIFTINAPLSNITVTPGVVGVAYTHVFFGGGTPPFTIQFPSGQPPPGLGSNSGGQLTGVPTTAGTFPLSPLLTDAWGNEFTPAETITILNQLLITTASLPNGAFGQSYSTTIAGTGGVTPYNWSATGLPAGLGINQATGVLSGIPSQSGTFTVNVTLTDSGSQMATATLGLNIAGPLSITTTSLPNGVINTAYTTTTLAKSGGIAPFTWSATGLPAGLTLNSGTGVLSGTPTQSGTFTVHVGLSDGSSQTASATLSLLIFSTVTITTTSLPSGVINTAYTPATLAASGGASPYAWSATGLPAGLTLNSQSGVLSGTPSQSGAFTVHVTLTDNSSQTATANLALNIASTLTITTTTLHSGVVNTAYTPATLAGSGGTTPYNWSATGLPAGLGLNQGTGVLSGTPSQSGSFTVHVTLTDASQQTATANLSLNIASTLVVTTSSLPNGRVNTQYASTLAGSGGTTPYAWSATGLPAGLTVNASSGAISGAPTQSGNFTVHVTLTDNSTQTATATLNLTVIATLSISTTSLPNGRINTAYATSLAGAGGSTPYAWSATGLPPGLSINSGSGAIAGTPTQSGTFTVHVTLTDSSEQTATATLSLNIVPTLLITTTGLPAGTVGTPYSFVLGVAGGLAPFSWSVTGLPAGLSANANAISGNPSQSGSAAVVVVLTDNSGQTARAQFPLVINPAPIPGVQVSGSFPDGTTGVPYSAPVTATGGNGGPYTFAAGGGVPPGLQLSNSGFLQGTPTTPGAFAFNVTASDSTGNTGSARLSMNVAAGSLVITTGTLPSVPAGSPIGVTFAASGGVPPYSFGLSGSAPDGTSFSTSGTLSGTPTTPGSYAFSVSVTDSAKTKASKGFTLVVTPAVLTIVTSTLPPGQVGTAYSGQFTATGGAPPYTWSGSAGGGLSVSSTGAVSGTPTSAGTFPVSVTVTDSVGAKANGNYSVIVTAPTLKVTTSSLPNGALTVPYSASLSATGGTAPYTFTVGGLPDGIAGSSSGSLTGTPTVQGAFTVSVTVKDSAGASASAALSLTILPPPPTITTTGITPPVLGTPFSTGFGATGGTPPYTWSAGNLPPGVSISSTGTLSGTPTAPGTTPITVTVTDSNGQKATVTLNLTVALPPPPTVTLTGFPATGSPGTQSTTPVTFSGTYPVDVTLNLTLTFTPLSGADDPNIQFSTGGRTATITIKAGTTVSTSSIGVQTGTVAGTITVTSHLIAAGQDITPSPAPVKTIIIGAAAPTITSVTAIRNSGGFTVTIIGFDTTRATTQATFTFTAAGGTTLQTSTVTVPATSLFTTWYQSSASGPFGSQFSFTIPFTVSGNVQSIVSLTVTLTNPTGTSAVASANLQ